MSGLQKPSAADEAAFQGAVDAVAAATERLLDALEARTMVRTRDGEIAKARERFARRQATLPRDG